MWHCQISLSGVFSEFFSIFHQESCFPRAPATSSSSSHHIFAPCSCTLTQFIYVHGFVLYSLTENKEGTLEIIGYFLFSSLSLFFLFSHAFSLFMFPLSHSSSSQIFPNSSIWSKGNVIQWSPLLASCGNLALRNSDFFMNEFKIGCITWICWGPQLLLVLLK